MYCYSLLVRPLVAVLFVPPQVAEFVVVVPHSQVEGYLVDCLVEVAPACWSVEVLVSGTVY